MQKNENAMDRLETIVKKTALAIRKGDLAIMGELAEQTDAALSELGPETDATRFAALRDLAQHNAAALEAASRGVRSAQRRLAEIVSARNGVQTYDNAGKTQKIGGPAGSLKARL